MAGKIRPGWYNTIYSKGLVVGLPVKLIHGRSHIASLQSQVLNLQVPPTESHLQINEKISEYPACRRYIVSMYPVRVKMSKLVQAKTYATRMWCERARVCVFSRGDR